MEERKQLEVIDLKDIIKKIWANRKTFILPLCIVFLVASIYIFSKPRYYSTDAKLAPEMGNNIGGGTLGTIASAFGFDFGDMQTTDAITPLLYPDLMEDNAFATNLFNIKVETQDGSIKTTYYDYLRNRQKKPWWGNFPNSIFNWIANLFKSESKTNGKSKELDPYSLSEKDDGIVAKIRNNIKLSVDKKTGVITINVQDQDPRICKTLADSVMGNLQKFITDYRTSKARTDYEYYKKLASEAKREYEKARQYYGSLSDANSKVALRSVELKMEDLENDMQLKFNTYTSLNAQLQSANVKVQDRTPVFTVLKGAAIPIKPAGPKRMIFVAGMLILAFMIKSIWLVRKDLHIRL